MWKHPIRCIIEKASYWSWPRNCQPILGRDIEYVKVDVVTVSASLSSVPAYVKYGFKFNGDTGISAGLVYQPMKIELILSHYNQL
ncbi:GNAT family N-acetyltransferase [Shewanella baltica]|nr:GNAT family N-acetyltransferase [Shewanella baltica]